MTKKSRRPSTARVVDGDVTPAPAPEPAETTPAPAGLAPAPAPVSPAPVPVVDRLAILNDYANQDGLLPVVVAVAHDAVFVGQHLRVPITGRVAGLIEIGFLEVEPLDPGTWR